MRLPPIVAALTVVVLAPSVAACGGDAAAGPCGSIRKEALDPQFLRHVGRDATARYLSDPPTSGPHQPGPEVTGTLDEPISRPVQVGLLEGGAVLVQHDPDLPAADVARLQGLVDAGVVLAPNPDLPAPVVATAWVHKLSCSEVDVAALREFVRERLGKGPDQPQD